MNRFLSEYRVNNSSTIAGTAVGAIVVCSNLTGSMEDNP